jgi:ABC-type Fe3+ transport system substrate-binding protein
MERDRDGKARVSDEKPPLGPDAAHTVEAKAAQRVGEEKVVQHYPPPEPDELPPPTFRQALLGYGSILLALVVLGVLIGILMKVLR